MCVKKFFFYVIISVLSNEVISELCHIKIPFIQFVKTGQSEDHLCDFKLQSGKKMNYKRAINGKINIHLSETSSDSIKLKKCLEINHSDKEKMVDISTSFKDDVAYGETKIWFKDESKIVINLDHNGLVEKNIQFLDEKDNMVKWKHCDHENFWTNNKALQMHVYSQKVDNNYLLTRNFDKYFLCKFVSLHYGSECFETEGSFLTIVDGFPFVSASSNVDRSSECFELDFKNGLKQNTNEHKDLMKCEDARNINDWVMSPLFRTMNEDFMTNNEKVRVIY